MPLYEYQCTKCGHEFEEMQKITEAPIKQCPKCKKMTVKKKVSTTSFQLKGDGWYKDGYSKSSSSSKSETCSCKCKGCPSTKGK